MDAPPAKPLVTGLAPFFLLPFTVGFSTGRSDYLLAAAVALLAAYGLKRLLLRPLLPPDRPPAVPSGSPGTLVLPGAAEPETLRPERDLSPERGLSPRRVLWRLHTDFLHIVRGFNLFPLRPFVAPAFVLAGMRLFNTAHRDLAVALMAAGALPLVASGLLWTLRSNFRTLQDLESMRKEGR